MKDMRKPQDAATSKGPKNVPTGNAVKHTTFGRVLPEVLTSAVFSDGGEDLTVTAYVDGSAQVSVGECPTWRTARLRPDQVRSLWHLLSVAVSAYTGAEL